MSLREMLAEWLAPEVALKAQKYEWIKREISTGYWWLSEFDEITAYTQWLLQHDHDSWRHLDEKPWMKWRWYGGVPEFREQIRNLRKQGLKLADTPHGKMATTEPQRLKRNPPLGG